MMGSKKDFSSMLQTPQMTKLKLALINKINNYGNDAKKEVELD
jgi:hypothetical protein